MNFSPPQCLCAKNIVPLIKLNQTPTPLLRRNSVSVVIGAPCPILQRTLQRSHCCWWKWCSFTESQRKHSSDPQMGDCGKIYLSGNRRFPLGSNVSSLSILPWNKSKLVFIKAKTKASMLKLSPAVCRRPQVLLDLCG